jgi:hypothetical protein
VVTYNPDLTFVDSMSDPGTNYTGLSNGTSNASDGGRDVVKSMEQLQILLLVLGIVFGLVAHFAIIVRTVEHWIRFASFVFLGATLMQSKYQDLGLGFIFKGCGGGITDGYVVTGRYLRSYSHDHLHKI